MSKDTGASAAQTGLSSSTEPASGLGHSAPIPSAGAWTPGPWSAVCADVTDERPVGDSGKRFWSIYPPCGVGQYRGSVANVFDAEQLGPQGLTLAERDANAALIASAPELYEALEPFTRGTSGGSWMKLFGHLTRSDFERAVAALAKARGE